LGRWPTDKVVDDDNQRGEVLVGVLLGFGKFRQLRVRLRELYVRVGLSLRKLLGGIVKKHMRLEQLMVLLMTLDVLIDEHFEELLNAIQAILLVPVCFVTHAGWFALPY
jgi:hypothetical protein